MKLAALAALAAALAVGWQLAGSSGDGVGSGSDEARGARIVRWSIDSRHAGRELRQVGVVPATARKRPPLLVFLHGRGDDGEESNANPAFFGALAALGRDAPAVVFPNGGTASYFHRRKSGDWALYVLGEVIPQAIRRLGADPRRVAIGGISMGGFGAFAVARRAGGRFCAVGGHSAALWRTGGETPAGAFDDAEDFDRHGDLIALARSRGRAPWGKAALWLDAGDSDPFFSAGRELATALGVRFLHAPGGHDRGYWFPRYRRYLRFYADALARCAR